MSDVRRFDYLEKVVAHERRRLDDLASTVLARLGNHAHASGTIDHGTLTGLADNDHSQYSLTSHSHDHGTLTGLSGNDHPQYSLTSHTHTFSTGGFGSATAEEAFVSTYATTSSTVYTTLTGNPGVWFIAPPSGSVLVHISAAQVGEAAGIGADASYRLGTGSTIGSGTQIIAASDDNRIACPGSDSQEAGRTDLVTGLSSGSIYNVQMRYKRTGASSLAGFARRKIAVWPTP